MFVGCCTGGRPAEARMYDSSTGIHSVTPSGAQDPE